MNTMGCYVASVSTMKLGCLVVLFILLHAAEGQQKDVFHLLDYKNVSVEDSGWLTLNQDESNPLILPDQYTLCVRVFKWYERLKYTSFGTINLLDDSGNITHQFTHAVSWGGRYIITEFGTRNYVYQDGQDLRTHEWSHVCYSVDFQNEKWKIFVDGQFVDDPDGETFLYDPVREKFKGGCF